jgi:DNA-binding response OmpR family regulator
MRVLLVEDDEMVGQALRTGLIQDGHAADWVKLAAQARTAWLTPAPDTVPYEAAIVDLSLPDGSGIDLIRAARARGLRTMVIIVTARGRVAERIEGLNAGADDYLVKPVDLDELGARLRAIDRRLAGRSEDELRAGALLIDPSTRIVTLHGLPVELSAREYNILLALCRRPGAVLSRAQIEEHLYGWDTSIESNTIEVHIYRLRRKLGRKAIENHRGLGYCLVTEELA